MHKFTKASQYIESLRHGEQRYARNYYQWIRGGMRDRNPNPNEVTYMAGKVIRENLFRILEVA